MPAITTTTPTPTAVHFPLILDSKAAEDPEGLYAILTPASLEATSLKTNTNVTWREFNQAVHRGAHLLNPLNPNGARASGRVIAILAVTDTLVYQTIVLAISRSGNVPFPISHRNSALAVANLLNKSNCSRVIVGGNPTITALMDSTQLELAEFKKDRATVIGLPTLKQLYPNLGEAAFDPAFKEYPLPFDTHLQLESPRLYLHSSGSTSLPKAILINEQYLRYMGRTSLIRQLGTVHRVGAMAPPPFHHMGLLCQIMVPFYNNGATIALWAPNFSESGEVLSPPVPTPENLLDSLLRAGCKGSIAVPSFMVYWSKDMKAMESLRGLDCVFTGGAPLPDAVGDALVAQGIKLIIGFGGTEFSNPTMVFSSLRAPEDWAYHEFSPEAPVYLREHDNGHEILYELVILAAKGFVPAVVNTMTPEGAGYATSDMWQLHPTKKRLYKMVGRLDDQITLTTGEKVNPGQIEFTVTNSPLIEAVAVFGRGRSQIGLIVEPAPGHEIDPADAKALAEFRNQIWPFVDAANHESPSFARIFKEAILPTTPGKPLARTPKAVISQKASVKLYEEEINNLCAEIDKARGGDDLVGPDGWGLDGLKNWLRNTTEELLEHGVEVERDIFDQGADSLTATILRNRLMGALNNAGLTAHAGKIDQNVVYAHPTVSFLATYVVGLLHSSGSSTTSVDSEQQHLADMKLLIERYTADLPSVSITPAFLPESSRETILVTGTTGALGSLILARLLENPNVENVWAVNRARKNDLSLLERQRQSFMDKAIDPVLLDDAVQNGKVVFVEAQLDAEKLGLNDELYAQILSTTTLIIHNAWRLDFNLSVMSFEPLIRGARRLADLALASPQPAAVRYIFISSVGALSGWKDASRSVPEEPISDPRHSLGNGYGEGKYVTEKILEVVTQGTGLSTTNIRVGQLSGTEANGFWSTNDWVPIMAESSVHLGALPDALGGVSWVPLNSAASAVLEVGLQRASKPEQTVHLYHPRPTSWSQVASGLSKALSSVPSLQGQQLPLVSLSRWVELLEVKAKGNTEEVIKTLPALKLLDFFKRLAMGDEVLRSASQDDAPEAVGQPKLATDKMQGLSPTIRGLVTLDAGHPTRWVEYWVSKELI